MPVATRHKKALSQLGIVTENYYVEGWPPVWGVALRKGADGPDIAVVESHGCHCDDDRLRNKYVLRTARSVSTGFHQEHGMEVVEYRGLEMAVCKTQRECFAAFARSVAIGRIVL